MVNDKWFICSKRTHVQPINHLSLTIDPCALRARKLLFYPKHHPLSGHRMRELQLLGVQAESFGRSAVERVAHDGAMQSLWMGGVYTELVGASRLRIKGNEGASVFSCQYFVIGQGRLAVQEVYYLTGAVVQVGTQREVDAPTVVGHQTVKQCDV